MPYLATLGRKPVENEIRPRQAHNVENEDDFAPLSLLHAYSPKILASVRHLLEFGVFTLLH